MQTLEAHFLISHSWMFQSIPALPTAVGKSTVVENLLLTAACPINKELLQEAPPLPHAAPEPVGTRATEGRAGTVPNNTKVVDTSR